jgi:protein transport protein SEC24
VRAALLARLECLPASATMPLVYGRLVPLHRVLAAALESSPAGDAPVAASQLDTLPLSSANVEPEGVYLLENSAEAWLYFGSNAPPALVADLLGALTRCVHKQR